MHAMNLVEMGFPGASRVRINSWMPKSPKNLLHPFKMNLQFPHPKKEFRPKFTDARKLRPFLPWRTSGMTSLKIPPIFEHHLQRWKNPSPFFDISPKIGWICSQFDEVPPGILYSNPPMSKWHSKVSIEFESTNGEWVFFKILQKSKF